MHTDSKKHETPTDANNVLAGRCFLAMFENGNEPFYLANWEGDPGRTLLKVNAKKFKTQKENELEYPKFPLADYIPILYWRFVSSNILPKEEGRYLVFDKFGNTDICLYANSGMMGETISFFEGDKKIVKARNIVAWTDLSFLKK